MIGLFRYRIEILRVDEVPDGGGGGLRSWHSSMKLWAAIIRVGNVTDDADISRSGVEVLTLRIRKNKMIGYDNRVEFRSKIYRIKSITPDFPRNKYLDLEIEEVHDA